MDFFDRGDDVGDMLDDVYKPDFAEYVVPEREFSRVNVGDDIGGGVAVAVDPNSAGMLVPAATDIKDQRSCCFGQSSQCNRKARSATGC